MTYLISGLSAENPEERRRAAWKLGGEKFDDSEYPLVVEALISALSDQAPVVRQWAAWALHQLDRHNDPRITAALIALLSDPKNSNDTLVEVLQGLVKCHDPNLTPLVIPCLTSRETKVRSAAAEVLGELRDPAAVEPLIAALEKEPESSLIVVLGKIADARAVDLLIRLLLKTAPKTLLDRYTPGSIADALAQIGDPRAIDPLIQTLAGAQRAAVGVSHYSGPRINYIDALGALKAVPAIETIKPFIQDDNGAVAAAAIKAIETLQALSGKEDKEFAAALAQRQQFLDRCAELRAVTAKGDIAGIISVIKEKAALAKGIVTSISGIPDILGDIKALEHIGIPAVVPVLGAFGDAAMLQRWEQIDLKERTAPILISKVVYEWVEAHIAH